MATAVYNFFVAFMGRKFADLLQNIRLFFSVQPLCALCLCGCCYSSTFNHRDTEHTEKASFALDINRLGIIITVFYA